MGVGVMVGVLVGVGVAVSVGVGVKVGVLVGVGVGVGGGYHSSAPISYISPPGYAPCCPSISVPKKGGPEIHIIA